jgi:glutathione S-transferase
LFVGVRYAFPTTISGVAREPPGLVGIRDRVAERKSIAAYLASDRRIPFNESGIFRKYAELDE